MVELRHVKYLIRVKITGTVLVDLLEAGVEFLYFFLAELTWKFGVTH